MERLSQQNRVIKICIDAGFLTTVDVGQYFMTKHTDEFLQFAEPVTCREFSLPRDEKSTGPKGCIRGKTRKLDPCWRSQPVTCKVNMEWKLELNLWTKTISHSWVRISHGLNKLVTDLSNKKYDDNEQETSETKTEVFAFASRSKTKAKPRKSSTTCSSSRTVPILERTWIEIEPGAQSDQAYPVANRMNTLLRHGELPRQEDGAIEFWRLKDDLLN